MDPMQLFALVMGSAGLGAIVKALADRRAVKAKAGLDDTTAAVALSGAAVELLDPLRKELAQERQRHLAEREAERAEVAELRSELAACKHEATELRNELAMARVEADQLRRARELDRAKIRVLENMLRKK